MNMTGATKNKLEIWILDKCKICGSPVHQHEVFYLYSKNKVVYRKAIYCYSHFVFSFQRTESISKYVVLRRSYQKSRLSSHHWTSSSCRDRIVASPSWRTSLKKWKSLIEVSRRFEMCNRELLKDEKSFQNRKMEEYYDSLPRDLANIDVVVRNCVRRLGGLLAYLNSSFYLARQCSSVYSYGKRVSMKTFLQTMNSDWMLLTLSPPRSH